MFNTNLIEAQGIISAMWPVTNRVVQTKPDNTDYDTLIQPGWYDLYTTDAEISHAPANGLGRVLLRVESVQMDDVWIILQCTREWYKSIELSTYKVWERWTYLYNGTILWIPWFEK